MLLERSRSRSGSSTTGGEFGGGAMPLLCLKAASDLSPAREAFLRDIASRDSLPKDRRAFAMLALAEYLSLRYDTVVDGGPASWQKPKTEEERYYRGRVAPEWIAYASETKGDPEVFKTESIELFRQILNKYADTPFTVTAPNVRDLKTIGDKARKSLHALEHLYVGAPAPDFSAIDLNGNPLNLADYRGKVVLLSFWFPTCGPCIAMVPQELQLIEKYRDAPFALIGVCRTSEVAWAKKVAAEHGMIWSSINDGKPGQVTDAYNIQAWPTFYLIDAEGRIASKDAPSTRLDEMIAILVERARQPAP